MNNIFKKFFSRNTGDERFVSTDEQVKHHADQVFKRYEKTFKDLARYDRGEKITTN